MQRFARTYVGGGLWLAAAMACVETTWAQSYQATAVGTLGGAASAAYGVNSLGQVVGASDVNDNEFHAFIWSNGQITDLGTLQGGTVSAAYSINDAGVVVGRSNNANGQNRAVKWEQVNGEWQIADLGTFGGSFGWATRINQAGQIVGYAGVSTGSYHAFRWTNGTMIDLGTLHFAGNFAYSQGLGINEAGQCVGFAYATLQGPEHGYWYDGTQQIDITPPERFGLAQGHNINDHGLICGYISSSATSGNFQAGVWSPQTQSWTLIPQVAGTNTSYAYDLNNLDDVVGVSYDPIPGEELSRGFLYRAGQVVILEDVTSGQPGAVIDAYDIADNGFIAANADVGGLGMGLLLAPVDAGCAEDLNGDGSVDLADLATLLTNFGTPNGASHAQGDVDADGDVDLTDLAALLAAFGTNC